MKLGAYAKFIVCGIMLALPLEKSVMAQPEPDAQTMAFVGSRTTQERNARGEGIETYEISDEGRWTHLATARLVNPSYLITNRDGSLLFTVHGDREEVSSFRINAMTGALDKISTASTSGNNPVHLALSPDEKYLIIVNHETGNVVSLPVAKDGSLGSVISSVALPGELGRNRLEQTSPHPHMALFDRQGTNFIVTAKGLDKVFVMSINDRGILKIVSEVKTRVGAGPRHGVFDHDGRTLYTVNEIDSSVTAYRYDDGKLEPFQLLVTLPDDFTGNSRAAAIVISKSGEYLFATNRGHDSIVRFAIDRLTGRLSSPEWVSSGGVRPRFLTMHPDGNSLLVTNTQTDTIVRLSIFHEDGALHEGQVIVESGSPVSIVFGQKR